MERLSNTPPNKHEREGREALDEELFSKLEKAYFEDYELLGGDAIRREEERKRLERGEIEQPVLHYPKLQEFDFVDHENQLLVLKDEAAKHKVVEVGQAYVWRVNELLAQLRMLKASSDIDRVQERLQELGTSGDAAERERLQVERARLDNRFYHYSTFIYGNPSRKVYEYDKATVQREARDAEHSGDAKRIDAVRALAKLVPDLFAPASAPTFGRVEASDAKDSTIIGAEAARRMFDEARQKLGLDDWKIVIDETGKVVNISASQKKKQVTIPRDDRLSVRRFPLTETRVRALIAHELGTHALRRKLGENSRLKLLGLGLDRYIKGEEGLATFREHHIDHQGDFSRVDPHLAISLAVGLDGTKRNFKEVYDGMALYYTMIGADSPPELAWRQCVRTFRGTSGTTRGAVYTKDIVYREGNVEAWERLRKGFNDIAAITEELGVDNPLLVGKYDQTNPRHVHLVGRIDAL